MVEQNYRLNWIRKNLTNVLEIWAYKSVLQYSFRKSQKSAKA